MLAAGMAFLLGILAVQSLPSLPPPLLLVGLAVTALFLARWRPTRTLAWLLAGAIWMAALAHHRLTDELPAHLQGADLTVDAEVVDSPRGDTHYASFPAVVLADDHGGVIPRHLRLGWYGQRPRLVPGQQWRFVVRLKRPHGTLNPGGFDRERWLFMRGWRATGYVRRAELVHDAQGRRRLTRWRRQLAASISAEGYRHAALLNSLTVGIRDAVSAEQWAVLRATGTSHLLAISGLHIGLLALAGQGLGGLVWRLIAPLQRRCNRPAFAAWIAFGCAAGYAALAGFSVPTQRALVMLAVVLLAVILQRPLRAGTALGLAMLGVLSWDPWATLSAGFWLSFGAVGAIAYLLAARAGAMSRLASFARVQWGLPLLLAPLALGFFDRAPWLAGVANLVAVPAVSLVILPSALLGTLAQWCWAPSQNLLLQLADGSLELLWQALRALASVPNSEWTRPQRSPLLGAVAVAGCLLLLAPRGLGVRGLGLALIVPLLLPASASLPVGAFRLHLLDVGQGQSVVVETRHHLLVYDTGVRVSADFDMGAAVVVPFLRSLGRDRLDVLVVSHGDRDHAGGVASVVAAMPPVRLYTSAPQALPPGSTPNACVGGSGWRWDGVRFEFLHPPAGWRGSDNNRSCVLKVTAGRHAALLPGDVEQRAERAMLAAHVDLAADILVVPHHGSATSTSAAFLAAVGPRYALYSVGYRNRFGFPSERVERRLDRAGVARLRSADQGTVSITVDTHGLTPPRSYRNEVRRYWHHRY